MDKNIERLLVPLLHERQFKNPVRDMIIEDPYYETVSLRSKYMFIASSRGFGKAYALKKLINSFYGEKKPDKLQPAYKFDKTQYGLL